MTLPARVRLNSTTYTVVRKDRKLFGRTDNRHSTIMVSTRQSDDQARDTLLHEVLHAILWCSGASHTLNVSFDDEERIVRTVAPWLLGALRDNPDLVRCLLGP